MSRIIVKGETMITTKIVLHNSMVDVVVRTSAKELDKISALVKEEFRQKVDEVIGNRLKNQRKLTNQLVDSVHVAVYLDTADNGLVNFWCPLSKIDELIRVFADEDIKTEIIMKAFEHV